ncbi:LacI family DNA-binding transcriptional regulator [Bifidobacterium felsineum]|uniref:LacI family transcriptional regulator n=1 Tax=Bifidobacterium felsineum TaxID=2045440 RepID=A0A2M9HLI0_9BIFI|nr:LacI family DNA-binding transcriptional regulator [Bifidobacterium felsineum]MBT1163170.1 LacI family DNA-binding transcriptional regulator [Bifidobacterium felsineum]PJM77649.1 LacI family transcriptional regulator [Bifidobacterium felsineum]
MVGMRDVAKEAGVSVSTVSLVVNGTGYVSDDMRAKVEAAMHELHYIPNELARNLYRNRTNTIGVIVPTILHPFFATLTAHLQREFAKRDLKTLLCSTADAATGESEYVNMLQRHMMDGIIMAAHTEHQPDYWTSINRPIVAFDRILGEGVPSVRSDHEAGGRMIARQLIGSGARHVVLVGGPRSQFAEGTTFPTVRYHLTVEQMTAEAGIACDYVEAGSVTDVVAHEATAAAIFQRYPDVDAIVGSDVVAAMALQEAERRGINVPDELQIIAYDGTMAAELAGKRLTMVRQDFAGIAAALAEQMDQQIEAENGSERSGQAGEPSNASESAQPGQVVPVSFIAGETTR